MHRITLSRLRNLSRSKLFLMVAIFYCAVVIGSPSVCIAQDYGEISGIVRDSARAPIEAVRITIINQATRSEVISYTSKDGFYRATALAPQYYTLEASRSGFQSTVRRDLVRRSN